MNCRFDTTEPLSHTATARSRRFFTGSGSSKKVQLRPAPQHWGQLWHNLPALELWSDGGLYEVVCLQVHGGRRLVQHQDQVIYSCQVKGHSSERRFSHDKGRFWVAQHLKLKKVRGSLFSDYLKRFLNNGTLTLADLRSKNPFNKKTEKNTRCSIVYYYTSRQI